MRTPLASYKSTEACANTSRDTNGCTTTSNASLHLRVFGLLALTGDPFTLTHNIRRADKESKVELKHNHVIVNMKKYFIYICPEFWTTPLMMMTLKISKCKFPLNLQVLLELWKETLNVECLCGHPKKFKKTKFALNYTNHSRINKPCRIHWLVSIRMELWQGFGVNKRSCLRWSFSVSARSQTKTRNFIPSTLRGEVSFATAEGLLRHVDTVGTRQLKF